MKINKERGIYPFIDRLFESAFVFNANQFLLDGGKARQIKRFLKDVPFSSVVDIGCGPGNWAVISRGRYLGIDTSPSFIESCQRRYAGDPQKEFVLSDATRLNVKEPFDLAMLISVLHHLSEEEMVRVLEWAARSARFFFVLDLYPNPSNPISSFLYAMDRGNYIREPAEQERILTTGNHFRIIEKSDYFSPPRLYRHTLYLLERTNETTTHD
jgi:SAM-dependent methyltransferase